jgi:hypothetical protein
MDALIILISAGLFAYWSMRTWLLLRGSAASANKTLDNDLRFLGRLWFAKLTPSAGERVQKRPAASSPSVSPSKYSADSDDKTRSA